MAVNFGLLQQTNNPAQMAMQGFEQAKQRRFGEADAARVADLQERQMTVQEGQFGVSQQASQAKQEALRQAQAKAKAAQDDLDAFNAIENPTDKEYAEFIRAHPDMAEPFKVAYDILDTGGQRDTFQKTAQLFSAVQNGNIELATELAELQLQAAENSDDPAIIAGAKSLITQLKLNPEGVKRSLGFAMAANEPDKFSDVMATIQPQPDETNDIENYKFAKGQGYKGSFADYQTDIKKAGSAKTSINLEKLSAGQRSFDAKAGGAIFDWKFGGRTDTIKLTSQLAKSLGILNSDQKVTGFLEGNVPTTILAMFNPEAVEVREQIAEVTQRNLKAILGGQFSEREGQQLIERAFNPKLPQATQARRAAALFKQMEAGIEAKDAMAKYFDENNGSLRGYTGIIPSMADFDAAVDSVLDEETDDIQGDAQEQVPTISDAAGYKALPSGTQYRDPSGVLRTKK